MARDKAAAAEDRAATKRVVLRREKVLVLPEGLDNAVIKAAQDVIRKANRSAGSGLATEAWVVLGEATGSKTQAIEAHAGKPGTPDALVGAFKAPSASSWGGGELYEAPPAPLVQRKPLEEAAAA